jgi:hypothetical protein
MDPLRQRRQRAGYLSEKLGEGIILRLQERGKIPHCAIDHLREAELDTVLHALEMAYAARRRQQMKGLKRTEGMHLQHFRPIV